MGGADNTDILCKVSKSLAASLLGVAGMRQEHCSTHCRERERLDCKEICKVAFSLVTAIESQGNIS